MDFFFFVMLLCKGCARMKFLEVKFSPRESDNLGFEKNQRNNGKYNFYIKGNDRLDKVYMEKDQHRDLFFVYLFFVTKALNHN